MSCFPSPAACETGVHPIDLGRRPIFVARADQIDVFESQPSTKSQLPSVNCYSPRKEGMRLLYHRVDNCSTVACCMLHVASTKPTYYSLASTRERHRHEGTKCQMAERGRNVKMTRMKVIPSIDQSVAKDIVKFTRHFEPFAFSFDEIDENEKRKSFSEAQRRKSQRRYERRLTFPIISTCTS
jgi:deoxyribodipyrimidine photolyase